MVTSLLATFIGFLLTPLNPSTAQAVSSDLLSGYTWSPNIGWTSFNCTTTGNCGTGVGQSNYGVTANASNPVRQLSGYAWSSTIGWITFNAAEMANDEPNCGLASYPPCAPVAEFNTLTGEVSGWARACSVYVTGCSGAVKAESYLGGWRGWIKLRGPGYGVLANGTAWTGYAWGGGPITGTGNWSPLIGGNAAIGWMSFRGYTTNGPKIVYGINVTGSAIGPQVLSCGVDKQFASTGSNVVWTAIYDSTKISINSYEWVSLANDFVNPVTANTEVHAYADVGVKTALVKVVTIGGEHYVVTCDGSPIGAVDPGYPSVLVGAFNLVGQTANIPALPNQGEPKAVSGTFTYSGPAVTTSFISRLEFDRDTGAGFDGAANEFSGNFNTSSLGDGSVTPITINVSGVTWAPAAQGTLNYRIRLCVDTPSPGSFSESNESDNCTAWSAPFSVGAPVVLPPSGSCTVVPKISRVNGVVTWDSAASGGNSTYTYAWTFNPAPSTFEGGTNATSPDPKVTYGAVGTKSASVVITSNAQSSAPISCASSVRIQTVTEE